MKSPQENEKCWVILGVRQGRFWVGRLKYMSTGEPHRVPFQADDVFERELECHDVLGFLHTHPTTAATPSQTDLATMQAWVTALGKPLICGIRGVDGLKTYLFPKESNRNFQISKAIRFGEWIVGMNSAKR